MIREGDIARQQHAINAVVYDLGIFRPAAAHDVRLCQNNVHFSTVVPKRWRGDCIGQQGCGLQERQYRFWRVADGADQWTSAAFQCCSHTRP